MSDITNERLSQISNESWNIVEAPTPEEIMEIAKELLQAREQLAIASTASDEDAELSDIQHTELMEARERIAELEEQVEINNDVIKKLYSVIDTIVSPPKD